jgi:hypothetical protein
MQLRNAFAQVLSDFCCGEALTVQIINKNFAKQETAGIEFFDSNFACYISCFLLNRQHSQYNEKIGAYHVTISWE